MKNKRFLKIYTYVTALPVFFGGLYGILIQESHWLFKLCMFCAMWLSLTAPLILANDKNIWMTMDELEENRDKAVKEWKNYKKAQEMLSHAAIELGKIKNKHGS